VGGGGGEGEGRKEGKYLDFKKVEYEVT